MLPDDVLQMVLAYLSPSDVAVARLACRHWRTVLGCYHCRLTLPTRFLGSKGARGVLRRTARYFPSVTCVTLRHADGWCDPVQARMDVEPLVRLERRAVTLEPLGAAGFSQLKRLRVCDASFTRDPWSLAQLAWLPHLADLEVAWDTGLWAPGQVLQEAEALQPVFAAGQLTALVLAKGARLFLGEAPLGDAALAAAAGLRQLVRLQLSTVSAGDEAFGALAGLTGLTALSLKGQLGVGLGTLSRVFAATTRLHTLELATLLPRNRDLRRISAGYGGGWREQRQQCQQRQQASSSSRSSSSAGGGGAHGARGGGPGGSSSGRPPRQPSPQQRQPSPQQQQLQRGSAGSWSSPHVWQQQGEQRQLAQQQRVAQQQQQQQPEITPAPSQGSRSAAGSSGRGRGRAAAPKQLVGSSGGSSDAGSAPALSRTSRGSSASSTSGAGSSSSGGSGGGSSSGASASGSSSARSSPQRPSAAAGAGAGTPGRGSSSSAAAVGSKRSPRFRGEDWSAVLLPLRRLRVLRLQSDLVLLGSCAALRGMGHVTHVELHGAAKFLAAGPFVSLPPSWVTQLPREAAAAAAAAAEAAAAAASSPAAAAAAAAAAGDASLGGSSGSSGGSGCFAGPLLLRAGGVWPALVSLHVDNLQLADGFLEGVAQLASLQTLIMSGPCLLAAQQQHHQQQQQQQGGPGRAHQPHQQHQQQQQQQQQQQVATAGGAAPWRPAFAAALSGLPDLSGLHGTAPGPSKAAAAAPGGRGAPLGAASGAEGSGRGSGSSSSSGSSSRDSDSDSSNGGGANAPSLLQPPAAAAAAAAHAPHHHHHQQQQAAPPLFQTLLDADVLTQLSPLSQLSRFELHLQQQLPCGLAMTPFALAHLSASWGGLTSICLNLPAPPPRLAAQPPRTPPAAAAAASSSTSAGAGAAADGCPAAQLLLSLGSFTCLKHLRLTMSDAVAGFASEASPRSLNPSHFSSTLSQHSGASGPLPAAGGGGGTAAAAAALLGGPPAADRAASSYLDLSSSHDGCTAAVAAAVAALPWGSLPASLESLSLSRAVGVGPEAIEALAAAAPNLRHLRLLHCQAPTSLLWVAARRLPGLHTLVVKEGSLGGLGSSGVAAVASLTQLTALGVTVEPGADVSVLGGLSNLRYLLLDGRSNTELRGVKGLRQLARLRALILPLLHLHHAARPVLSALQLALPDTHIANVSRNFGQHHGCSWFRAFSAAEREWWREPDQPWAWYPTLDIQP